MITLAILNQMVQDGVADLTKNKDLFWEEVPLSAGGKPAEGVWLLTRPGDIQESRKGLNLRSTVDFYVGFSNKAKTEVVLKAIREWLTSNRGWCELKGTVDGTNYSYDFTNVRVWPTSTPDNSFTTENNVIVKVASALLVYDEPNTN